MSKTALLGFHEENDGLELVLEASGYDIEKAGSDDEMLKKMGIPKDSAPDSPPKKPYDLYCMDANLGSPNSNDCGPSLNIYQHVKKDVEAGKVKFLAVSGNPYAVKRAQEAGIPAADKLDIFKELLG